MRAAIAEPEADGAAREETAERSGLREGDEDDRKPKEAAGALDGGLRALVEAEAEAVEENEVGAAAAINVVAFGVGEETEKNVCDNRAQ